MIEQKFIQLMGPQHPGYLGKQGASWQHPDTANSSSIKPFYFHGGFAAAWWCTWSLFWQPGANGTSKTRLVAMDTDGPGYGNWQTLAQFDGPSNRGPMISAVDLTAVFNQMISAKVSKYIGFQMWDDGMVPYLLWESRIELDTIIPGASMQAKQLSAKLMKTAAASTKPAVAGPVVHADASDFVARISSMPRPPMKAAG